MNFTKYRNDKNFPYYRCINVYDKINLFTTDKHNVTSIFRPISFEPFEGKSNIRNIATVVSFNNIRGSQNFGIKYSSY